MNRLALFTVALLIVVAIGSESGKSGSLTKSMNSMCVCVPARAKVLLKSAMAKTQMAKTQSHSTAQASSNAVLSQ